MSKEMEVSIFNLFTFWGSLRKEQAIDLDKSQRYATNLQNRMLKGFSALAALDQHELVMKNQQQLVASVAPVLVVAPKESEPKKPDSGQK